MGGTDLGAGHGRARLTLPSPIRPADVPALCDRALTLMREGLVDELECDVTGVTHPDLGTVEALARVGLTARRLGSDICLRGPSVELLELLALCGLPVEVVLEPEGEVEHREEAHGVEEEGDPGDPVT
jgi:ABC-type transporter Mla MlaB component